MTPRPGLTVKDRHAASPPSSRQAPSHPPPPCPNRLLSLPGRLSRRLRRTKPANILVEIPTRDGDPRSDLGNHASYWPGTYSDHYVKQATTGTGGEIGSVWGSAARGRSWPSRVLPLPLWLQSHGIDVLGDLRRCLAESSSTSLPWPSLQDTDSAAVILYQV